MMDWAARVVAALVLVLAACSGRMPGGYQGYIEGDYIYVASPLAGHVETLAVQKGDRVAVNAFRAWFSNEDAHDAHENVSEVGVGSCDPEPGDRDGAGQAASLPRF